MNAGTAVASAPRLLLLLVWCCFLVRGAFYACVLPLWEGYDEWAHYSFIQYIANHRRLPVPTQDRVSLEVQESMRLVPLPWEFRSLPQPYLTHDTYWRLPAGERERRERQLRSLPEDWSRQPAPEGFMIYEALQPPLYYWPSSWIYGLVAGQPLASRILVLRLWSIAVASLVIPLGFLVARQVFQDRRMAVSLAALVAAMPELMIDVARVGNECLGIALFSLVLYASIKLSEDYRHEAWAGLLGLALGLGLLTKVYFLTALPALLVIFCWHCWKRPGERRAIVLSAAIASGIALAISGWWYGRNLLMAGTLSGLSESVMLRNVSLAERLGQAPRVDWARALDSILLSHIWFGGWSGLQVRSWMYHFLYGVGALAAAGLLVLALRLRRGHTRLPGSPSPASLFVLLSFFGFLWLGQAYNVLLLFLSKGASTSMGWYLYCLVAAEVPLIAAGLLALSPASLRPWVIPAATACFALLDLYTVHFLLVPYYTGLIAHKPNGFLASFYPGQLRQIGLGGVLLRLNANKAEGLSSGALMLLWSLYSIATLGLVWLACRRAGGRLQAPPSAPADASVNQPHAGRR